MPTAVHTVPLHVALYTPPPPPQKRGVVQQTTKPAKQQKPAKSKTRTTTAPERTGLAATLQKQNRAAAKKAKLLAAARASSTTSQQKHKPGPVVTAQLPAELSADSIFSLSVANNFKITVSNPAAGHAREYKPARDRAPRAKPFQHAQIIKPGQPMPVAARPASRPRKAPAPKPRIVKP